MKIVVCLEPDPDELILNDLPEEDFIVDPETYYYFRDEVFIKGMLKYIEEKHPGKLKDAEKKPSELKPDASSEARKVEIWHNIQDIISKYYPKFNKVRDKFLLYKGGFYSYSFLGFANVGNEIQLLKHEKEDILQIINRAFHQSKLDFRV